MNRGEGKSFFEEWKRFTPQGSVKFDGEKRRLLFLTEKEGSEGMAMSISFPSIDQLFTLSTKTTTPSILFVLNRVPIFEKVNSKNATNPLSSVTPANLGPLAPFAGLVEEMMGKVNLKSSPRQRKPSLHPTSSLVAPFTSLHFLISFPSPQYGDQFYHRRTQGTRLPRIQPSSIKLDQDHKQFSSNTLSQIHHTCAQLPIPVAFQVERLLWNGLLTALEICEVLEEILRRVKTLGVVQVEGALIKFGDSLLPRSEIEFVEDLEDEGFSEEGAIFLGEKTNGPTPKSTSSRFPPLPKKPPSLLLRLQHFLRSPRNATSPIDPNSLQIRHLLITPVGFTLEGPIPEVSNSVLRFYGNTDCFIRVLTRDEGLERFQNDSESPLGPFLAERYLPSLRDGVVICGRKFEFLGYSVSSLRESSVWFVAWVLLHSLCASMFS